MPHLKSFRSGWQSQNLARCILYNFCFLAEPVQSADDIGIDFFCTIFESEGKTVHWQLIPKNSFAIQIKSKEASARISLTGYLPCLAALEIPFFIGVVDRNQLSLSVFSGEYLTPFFSYKGIPKQLDAELVDLPPTDLFGFYMENSPNEFVLRFPKVRDIKLLMSDEELDRATGAIGQKCSLIQDNIAAITRHEFILKGDSPYSQWIFAGIGSLTFFQQNFLDRLTEVFFNLHWLFQFDQMKEQVKGTLKLYENIYSQLASAYGEDSFPTLLRASYHNAKQRIEAPESPPPS